MGVLALLFAVSLIGVGLFVATTDSDPPPPSDRVATVEGWKAEPVDEQPSEALLAATANGVSARLESASPTCVHLSTSPPSDSGPDVCLSDAEPRLAGDATTLAGTTIVYGIGAGVRDVQGVVEQKATIETKQAAFGERWVFVLIINVPDADGTVLGRPVADDEPPFGVVFGSGIPGVDPNPQRDQAVQLPPPAQIRYVFEHQRQIWANLESGGTVPLTGDKAGAGGGMVSPDGSTVLFGRIAGVFDDLIALDVRTGATRKVGSAGGAAFSGGGALAVALPFDDSPVPVDIALYEAGTLAERSRVTLGMSDVVGSVRAIAWSRGDSELLVDTATHLFVVDVASRRVRELSGRAGLASGSPMGSLLFGRGDRLGRHFALRELDGRLEVGTLSTSGGRATFEPSGVVTRTTPEAVLDVPTYYFSPVGKVRAEMVSDAGFQLVAGDVEAALVGDGETLFLVSSTGELAYLSSKVRAAGGR